MSKSFQRHSLPNRRRQLELLVQEIHRLAEENQHLDCDIPSQYSQKLANLDAIFLLETKIDALKHEAQQYQRKHPNSPVLGPVSLDYARAKKRSAQPVTVRGHLKLYRGGKA